MKKIEDLIRQYDHAAADAVDMHIKVKLKIINGIFEDIKDSEDRIYMEEIISKFAEIVECQRGVIGELMSEIAAEAGYGPASTKHNFVATGNLSAEDIPWSADCKPCEVQQTRELPSYLPPEGGFQKDEQVKKAFTNYLTYHVNRKTKSGKDKPFSIHTIYDYCSRIKVLFEIVYDWIQLDEQTILPGCTFLNAYHNISALNKYIEMKSTELREISIGLREPLPAEEAQRNPLNNPRNLGNTTAALAKFAEFKEAIY